MKKQVLMMIAACTMLVFVSNQLLAQDAGDLDTDFGVNGYAMTDHVQNTGEIYTAMITLPDDKIVMVGYTDTDNQNILVARFHPDGSPDLDFASYGVLELDASIGANEEALAVTALSNGQLLVAGIIVGETSWDGFIMRIDEDGIVDASFGTTASGRTNFNAGDNTIAIGRKIIVLEDNSILVGGAAMFDEQSDLCVFKFTQGGGQDLSFASSGVASLDIEGDHDELNDMALTSNGQILLAGTSESGSTERGVVAQLSSYGTPTTFAGTGFYLMNMGTDENEVNAIMVDANDKIIAVGSAGDSPNTDGIIFRLNEDGSIDETFSDDGYQSSDPGVSTALRLMSVFPQENGGVLACGYTYGNMEEAYAFVMNEDGSPNGDFGGNGDASIAFAISVNSLSGSSAALQSDGRILIGGNLTSEDFVGNNLFIVRIIPQGLPDMILEESDDLNLVYPNPVYDQFRIQTANPVQYVELYSAQGTLVTKWTNTNVYQLPTGIACGTYVLGILCDGKYSAQMLVVKK